MNGDLKELKELAERALTVKSLRAVLEAFSAFHSAASPSVVLELIRRVPEWLPIEQYDIKKHGPRVLIAGGTSWGDNETFPQPTPVEDRIDIAYFDPDHHGDHKWCAGNCGGHDEYYWHKPECFAVLPTPSTPKPQKDEER